MRRRVVAAWLTAVVALSAAVRHADDPMSASSASGAKHDRHVAVGDHVTSTQRYVNRKLDELETRLGRRLAEQAKRLNQSITIHYLEKVKLLALLASCHQFIVMYCIPDCLLTRLSLDFQVLRSCFLYIILEQLQSVLKVLWR